MVMPNSQGVLHMPLLTIMSIGSHMDETLSVVYILIKLTG